MTPQETSLDKLEKAIAKHRSAYLKFCDNIEDLDIEQSKPEELKKSLKMGKQFCQEVATLDKITSNKAPRFRYDFSNFNPPDYPGGGLLSDEQTRQEEYKRWLKDQVLEHIITQEENYLTKYRDQFTKPPEAGEETKEVYKTKEVIEILKK